MDNLTPPGTEVVDEQAEVAAELCAVLEIGKALGPLTEESRRRVVARLLAELEMLTERR